MGSPAQIGRYTVERPLGEGGMASAVLARHAVTGERVVLKIPFSAADDVKERVRDEARMGLRLSHPHIVETLDLVEHEGKPVLVVRYVEGCALKDWWALGPAPVIAVAHVGAQIADALAAIHEATDEHGAPLGTLHRDVAPGNVLINTAGDALLIDLGIARSSESRAKRTEVGVVKGTLRYLAPELIEGSPHTVSTDLWALGVCLFEAAVGRRAVGGDDRVILNAVLRRSLFDLKPGEHVDPDLLSIVHALTGPADARFSHARAAKNALASLRDKHGGEDAGAAFCAAWVARCPQNNNVGAQPGDDDPRTAIDNSIGSGPVRSAPGPSDAAPQPAAGAPAAAATAPTVVIPASRWQEPKATVLLPSAPVVDAPQAEASIARASGSRPPWLGAVVGAIAAVAVAIVVVWLFG